MTIYLFDWDNTLLNTNIYRETYNDILSIIKKKTKYSLEEIKILALKNKLRLYNDGYFDSGELSKLFKINDEYYLIIKEVASKKNYMIQENFNILKEFKKRGHSIGIITNSFSHTMNMFNELYILDEYVDFIFTQDDANCMKKETLFWEKLIKEKNLIPNKCVVIGDHEIEDKLIPKKLGFKIGDFNDINAI